MPYCTAVAVTKIAEATSSALTMLSEMIPEPVVAVVETKTAPVAVSVLTHHTLLPVTTKSVITSAA